MRLGLRMNHTDNMSPGNFLWMANALSMRNVQFGLQVLSTLDSAQRKEIAGLCDELPMTLGVSLTLDDQQQASLLLEHPAIPVDAFYLKPSEPMHGDPEHLIAEIVHFAIETGIPIVLSKRFTDTLSAKLDSISGTIETEMQRPLTVFHSPVTPDDLQDTLSQLNAGTYRDEQELRIKAIELDVLHPIFTDDQYAFMFDSTIVTLSKADIVVFLYSRDDQALIDTADSLYRGERKLVRKGFIMEEFWG